MTYQERRLMQKPEVINMLQLDEKAFAWLVETEQLRPIRICGQERFDSKDVYQLIESYKAIQGRKK